MHVPPHVFFFFFFNDTATTEIYTLSLHDALPIWSPPSRGCDDQVASGGGTTTSSYQCRRLMRSEEHTSELQSRPHLVCRLLLEKKKARDSGEASAACLAACGGCWCRLLRRGASTP